MSILTEVLRLVLSGGTEQKSIWLLLIMLLFFNLLKDYKAKKVHLILSSTIPVGLITAAPLGPYSS